MIIFLSFSALAFFIVLWSLLFLIYFPDFKQELPQLQHQLSFSIIVAMKNEEKNLANLFSALSKLNYPAKQYEVILVDDNSTDNTFQTAQKYSHLIANCSVLKAEEKKYFGKRGALDVGINNSKYSIILITDADCMPAKNWLNGFSEKFKDGFDIIIGLAPFVQNKKIINRLICFDNLRSSILTFVLAALKAPYSAAARNFGFRIEAYKKLNGFSGTQQTQSGDDDLLIREAVKANLKIGILNYDETLVLSSTKNSLFEFINQRARHVKTSAYYLLRHKVFLAFWHFSNIAVLFSILFFPFNNTFVLPFLIKLICDLIVVIVIQKRMGYYFGILEIVLYQIFYELFLIINYLASFRRNIKWK